MTDLVRVSFSLEQPLFDKLGELVEATGTTNRSKLIRDLIRRRLVEEEWEANHEAVGTITLVYDHHARRLSERLTELQHHHHDHVLATTHVHLDAHLCAEMIMVRGQAQQIRTLSDQLARQKGILHATLALSSTGEDLA